MQQRSKYGQPSVAQSSRWAWLDVDRRSLTKPPDTEITAGWSLRRAIELLDDALDAIGAQLARAASASWSCDATLQGQVHLSTDFRDGDPDERNLRILSMTRGALMNDNPHATNAGQADARRQVINLVTQAQAIVESLEMEDPRGRWALTAFGRHRVRELLGLTPYEPYVGDIQADPADLYDRAALAVDEFDVPIDEVSWRLALADALRTAARDIRMVQDATRQV